MMNGNAIDIRSHLLQYADLSLFWILRTDHIQPGLIHYLGSDGTAYTLMDDDDERVEKCIVFLEDMGSPVFADANEMDNYAAQLADASR
ncbi:hypothetical protein GC197_18355 [bacterium]|nr:hypothetical protein [bacterium]